MFKIAIDAGHYLGISGKSVLESLDPKEIREWVLNDRVVSKVESLLEGYTGYALRLSFGCWCAGVA